MQINVKGLYSTVLRNKFVTICILFTVFTLLDTIPILLGWWPAKSELDPYVHLLGRFALHSLLVFGVYSYDLISKVVKSKLIVYGIAYLMTWGALLVYLWINSLFIELHPKAYIDASMSYTFMFLLAGILILIANEWRRKK